MISKIGFCDAREFLKSIHRINAFTARKIKNNEEVEIINEINEDVKKLIDNGVTSQEELDPLRDLCLALANHEELSATHKASYGWQLIRLKRAK